MLQIYLIITGFLLLLTHQFIYPFPEELQMSFFLLGIILLGVPHGAADLLVAMQNVGSSKKTFSKIRFFVNYLSRLVIFGAIIWLFPLVGIILFIIFAAYHFGETDLHYYKTESLSGKLLVTSYGMVILSVLLLHHLEEAKPIVSYIDRGNQVTNILYFLESKKTLIITITIFTFIASILFYFVRNKMSFHKTDLINLIRFICILFILFNLPLIPGFTFYFIFWHSLLSMNNIIGYLRNDKLNKPILIFKQIVGYSSLAIAGILIVGFTGLMFLNSDSFMSYIFMGLAVLTAPHMQIMHDMYNKIRSA